MANTKDLESSAISASKIKLSTSSKTFYVICYVVVAVVAIICLIPFLLLISGSFTSPAPVFSVITPKTYSTSTGPLLHEVKMPETRTAPRMTDKMRLYRMFKSIIL